MFNLHNLNDREFQRWPPSANKISTHVGFKRPVHFLVTIYIKCNSDPS